MTDYTGKAHFFVAFRCSAEHEEVGDRFFTLHADWMERTHPREGDEALLQYTVSKQLDEEGNVLFLLSEVYETVAGVKNHSRLFHENDERSELRQSFGSFVDECETIGWGDSEVVHALW